MGGLFQRDFQVVAQVGTAVHLRAAAIAAAAAAEDVAEDVAEGIAEAAAAKAATAAHVRIHAGVTVAVIRLALFRIGQHLIGFLDFLELLFGLFVVRIAVRMVLHRELAISLLDLVFRGVFGQAEDLVKITLCHVQAPN